MYANADGNKNNKRETTERMNERRKGENREHRRLYWSKNRTYVRSFVVSSSILENESNLIRFHGDGGGGRQRLCANIRHWHCVLLWWSFFAFRSFFHSLESIYLFFAWNEMNACMRRCGLLECLADWLLATATMLCAEGARGMSGQLCISPWRMNGIEGTMASPASWRRQTNSNKNWNENGNGDGVLSSFTVNCFIGEERVKSQWKSEIGKWRIPFAGMNGIFPCSRWGAARVHIK